MTSDLIFLLVGTAGFALFYLPRYLRTKRALESPSSSSECAACQSTDVTEVSPRAFRCDGCRFQWGPGWKEQADAQVAAQLASMSAADRRALASSELAEAKARLVAAAAAIDHAEGQLVGDIIVHGASMGDSASRARSEAVVQASIEMGLAQKHIRQAALAADGAFEHEEVDSNVSANVIGLDQVFDGLLGDIAAHQQASQLGHRCMALLEAVKRAEAALESPSTPAPYR